MKNILILTTVLLGSTVMMNDTHHNTKLEASSELESPAKSNRRSVKSGPIGTVSILIDKSDYTLSVYDDKGWYATYPVVFGNNSLDDKKMEGDKNTPEGTFRINSRRPHDKWYRFMGIDYPTKESWAKFKLRKQRGEIPASASIGGAIGIHGTWPHEDFVIDNYKNWTMGCISMKNSDVNELYSFTSPGTQVVIRK